MMLFVRSAIFVVIVGALAGCGGGGSGLTTANPLTAQRASVSGDTFNYSLTGTYSQTPLTQNAATSGTATEVFTADTYNGQTALQKTITTVFAENGSPTTLTDTTQYSAAGVALAQTDGSSIQAVTAGGFAISPILSASTNITATETLADGTTITLHYTVTGKTTITTPAGTFACWTATRTVAYSDGFSSSDTVDYAPSLGAPVQETIQSTYSGGLTLNLTSKLTSYTFGSF